VENPALRRSLLITLAFVIATVAIQVVLGIALAVPLSRQTRAMNAASTLLLLPLAVTPAVSALVARQLLNPNYGWIDHYLQVLGVVDGPVTWLGSGPTAWVALIALDVWQWTPFVALIIVAGLTGIPHEPREAAAVDGASAWQSFRYITLPMLVPFIAIAAILRTIQAFKTFDSFKVLTDGGPGVATEIVNLAIYRVALQSFRVGAASTLGIFFLLVLLIIVPQLLRAFREDDTEAEGI
jgi:multiple sugar transport system permease protein